MGILRKIFGTKNDREIKRLSEMVAHINTFSDSVAKLTDDELRAKIADFKQEYQNGRSLMSLLPETFAITREASSRSLGMRHFDVQLMGGIILCEGKIAEMKTGEGKTLTATLPLVLNAISGHGAHLVTVNDYLATRDSEWMGQLYSFLGLTTGLIVHGLTDKQRQVAYGSDITYGTNNEFGFDYLRDNMKTSLERFVQRDHFFAIVDEVDSILIDEARTPLIISGPTNDRTDLYVVVNNAIPGLQKDSDYIFDEKSNTVSLTEDGISKVEKRLKLDNLYDPKNIDYLHHVQQALKAHVIFKKDVDYVVRDNKVVIVDEFTGRLMPGRRYSDGLHGALEAKEHLHIESENQTLATITFQNYFRLYTTLSGMTGTADTEAVEFKKIYNLDVVVIPPNKKMIRIDHNDVIYRTAREKFNVIADEIARKQKIGQPVLVGTVSVEKSELLSNLLKKRNIPHDILNAKNHAAEADIIKSAGQKNHVTISTNMAGRGTDIVLGEGVRELGGLCVIGTERHESRRIDNQLRGRSGRQGDPGESQFFLSLEDDLMRIFAADRLSGIMGRLGMKEGEPIISSLVTRSIERAQKRVEERNFSSRKHLIEYDDVMNQQRQVIYKKRRALLEGNFSIMEILSNSLLANIDSIVHNLSPAVTMEDSWDFNKLKQSIEREFATPVDLSSLNTESLDDVISDTIHAQILAAYNKKRDGVGEDMVQIENYIYLQIMDVAWKDHLLNMDQLKDAVSLRGFGHRDPLQEYKKEAFILFRDMMERMENQTMLALIRMPPPRRVVPEVEPEETTNDVDSDSSSSYNDNREEDTSSQSSMTSSEMLSDLKRTSQKQEVSESQMQYNGGGSRPTSTKRNDIPYKRTEAKVGRNDPCPCGSGKKYKKCCGLKQQ